ncbi:MAG: hypothetical protein FWD61_17475 [Phycisphaerales bacterium]|nr:hypothetical protein [Phycisphaerales bacterium]
MFGIRKLRTVVEFLLYPHVDRRFHLTVFRVAVFLRRFRHITHPLAWLAAFLLILQVLLPRWANPWVGALGESLHWVHWCEAFLLVIVLTVAGTEWWYKWRTDPIPLGMRPKSLWVPTAKPTSARFVTDRTSSDYETLIKMGYEAFYAYGGNLETRREEYAALLLEHAPAGQSQAPDSRTFLLVTVPDRPNEIIGFTCVMSITSHGCYRVMAEGHEPWDDLTCADRQPCLGNHVNNHICLQILYVRKQYSGQEKYQRLMMQALVAHVRAFIHTPAAADRQIWPYLCAHGLTPRGSRLLTNLGFIPVVKAKDGTYMYGLDLNRIDLVHDQKREFGRLLMAS